MPLEAEADMPLEAEADMPLEQEGMPLEEEAFRSLAEVDWGNIPVVAFLVVQDNLVDLPLRLEEERFLEHNQEEDQQEEDLGLAEGDW